MASAAEQLAANLDVGAFAKATELHKRLLFTLGAMIVYRLGTYIPIPGVDPAAIAQIIDRQQNGIFGMANLFSGGAVARMAIFALNVMPYISASIMMQLMGAVYPPWEKLRKDGGEAGRKQLNQYTRYLSVVLAVFQAGGIAIGLQASQGAVLNPGPFFIVSTVVTLTTGTMFLMWLGEQVTTRGVGNGVSLIIFAGIVARMPTMVFQLFSQTRTGTVSGGTLLLVLAIVVGVIVFIVFMERAQRRLLVQYPKRQQGNRMYGGETSFLPLKVNVSGVIPPIFASSLLALPFTATTFLNQANLPSGLQWLPGIASELNPGRPAYMLFYGAMILFFTFFYTPYVLNPEETADNLRKSGGFLPGIRPGRRTAEYIDFVLTRITVIGALYLTAVCLLPQALMASYNINTLYFGGTSIMIVVAVMMDTVDQIQSHLLAHQYEGLIKKSKLRGGKR
ncbi:MAG: preprotein translocase subunit SecY [Caulobacteraceae bacterium]